MNQNKTVFFLSGEWTSLNKLVQGEIAEPEGQPDLYLPWLAYKRRGYNVHVFYLGNFTENSKLDFHGVNLHLVGRSPFFRWRNRQQFLHMRFPADCIILYWAAMKVAQDSPPDIVYAVQPWLSYTALALKCRYGCLTVKHIFGTWLYFDWMYSRNLRTKIACVPHFLAWKIPADLFIIMNDGTEGDKVARMLRVPSDRIRFWMNGVNKDLHTTAGRIEKIRQFLGIENGHLVLMCLSRLASWKRQDRVIKAMPEILAMHPETKLVLVGDGQYRGELEKMVHSMNIDSNVIFTGQVPHNEVRDYLSLADIFLQTNDLSCLGNSLLEAMVCGRAIITWDVGATHDLVKDGINGMLLTDAEPYTLAKAVIELAQDPVRRKFLAQSARSYALNVLKSWDERLDDEINLVEKWLNY